MAIVVLLRNQPARMKDILAPLQILWQVIASLKVHVKKRDLAARVMLVSVKEKKRKDARRKIAVKSKPFRKCRYSPILPYRIQIKGRVYGLFRVLTNEMFDVEKLKYL